MRYSVAAQFLVSVTESYFAGRSKKYGFASSYYVLGFREDFLVGRVSAFGDILRRVARLLAFGPGRYLSVWTIGGFYKSLPALTWFARTASINLYSTLGRHYSILFQGGRFFAIRSFVFTIAAIHFLGVDVLLALTQASPLAQYQINAVRSTGIPTVGLVFDLAALHGVYTYAFLCVGQSSRMFVFFLRLFVNFFSYRS